MRVDVLWYGGKGGKEGKPRKLPVPAGEEPIVQNSPDDSEGESQERLWQ